MVELSWWNIPSHLNSPSFQVSTSPFLSTTTVATLGNQLWWPLVLHAQLWWPTLNLDSHLLITKLGGELRRPHLCDHQFRPLTTIYDYKLQQNSHSIINLDITFTRPTSASTTIFDCKLWQNSPLMINHNDNH